MFRPRIALPEINQDVRNYTRAIYAAGMEPVVISVQTEQIDNKYQQEYLDYSGFHVNAYDGLLLPGGWDVNPIRYGQENNGSKEIRDDLDTLQLAVLDEFVQEKKPVLGICRGIQFINAVLGGTLYQDLPTQHPSSVEHHQTPPYDVPVHEVKVRKGTPLYECLGLEAIRVNSYHHQAVKDVAPGFEVMAGSEDGLVEAVYRPGSKFLWAVQWHPEFSFKTDVNSKRIFRAFVECQL